MALLVSDYAQMDGHTMLIGAQQMGGGALVLGNCIMDRNGSYNSSLVMLTLLGSNLRACLSQLRQ